MHYKLLHGDNRSQLQSIPDNSIDSIVCDPPYELGFMGKKWDSTGIAYDTTVWTECLRVLKPGGHLIAFGGTRTYHRMTVAIEDAGFEIRDCIMWLYGSGFPKSHNLQGDWHGFGTALKPAVEPAVLARKPLIGTVADNVTTWGVGAINIDGCRVELSNGESAPSGGGTRGTNSILDYFGGMFQEGKKHTGNTTPPSGRWPANVILDEDAGEALDAQSDARPSRFFYTAKASKAEREAGLEGMEKIRSIMDNQTIAEIKRGNTEYKSGEGKLQIGAVEPRANHHPTVKPIALMRYLVRLVTPKDGTVLDPFMGSGSTGCAAMCEGVNFVGIELSEEYLEIARRRIEYWQRQNPMGL